MPEQAAQVGNPFPGLRAFEPSETHLFFGRDGQSERRQRGLAVQAAAADGDAGEYVG